MRRASVGGVEPRRGRKKTFGPKGGPASVALPLAPRTQRRRRGAAEEFAERPGADRRAVEEGDRVRPCVGAQLAGALQGDDVIDEGRELPVTPDALGGEEGDQVGGGFLDDREAGQLEPAQEHVLSG